ncbi:MAG TPA: family 16 glycoside hydrolase [Pirellulales bacterium]|nr:family 16 glycoside hydrolase [Pirellulales bacterium]
MRLRPPLRRAALALALLCLPAASALADEWKPGVAPLMTRWAKDVSPKNAHPEYPRPQLVRPQWQSLNGLWELAIGGGEQVAPPDKFDQQILVPFPVESALSGVMQSAHHLWYRRTFEVPANWHDKRILLHFGAVDWRATVWLNGHELGTHKGGFDAFTFDVTDALNPTGPQRLVVSAFDPSSSGTQARGKQVDKPDSYWYTPSTGIWQTVWLEPVSAPHVERLEIVPDFDAGAVKLTVVGAGTADTDRVEAVVSVDSTEVARRRGTPGTEITIPIPNPKPWSPDEPFLYNLEVTISQGDRVVDRVESYCGLRKISLVRDDSGRQQIALNGKPLFITAPLDQGFWPDGLYTAPTDDALKYDVELTKKLGFNASRKHIKVEPDRWYYWCDVLGLLVWQDMPSASNNTPEIQRQFEVELERMIAGRKNHPSIVHWILFNEGWGQFDTERLTEKIHRLDPTRLVTDASGWADKGVGNVLDTHVYPGPLAPTPDSARATVLGEFGGLGLAVEGHRWGAADWVRNRALASDELTSRYTDLWQKTWELHESAGLAAAVYTQLTDVETETNGLVTYDRAEIKLDLAQAVRAARGQFAERKNIVATSEASGQDWRFTFDTPGDNWNVTSFDDSAWQTGPGGFGKEEQPGANPRTAWKTTDVWLRRPFEIVAAPLGTAALRLRHDDDVQVYINGRLIADRAGYSQEYYTLPLDNAARSALKPGKNLLAVHCHQTAGDQFVDAGLIELVEAAVAEVAPANAWVSMFDGKTLGQWQPTKFAGQGEVEIDDGQIRLGFGNELTGITWSGPPPKMDYEVELEARRIDGIDFFCGLTFPVGDSPCSFIVGGWGGGVVGLSSLDGKDAVRNETTRFVAFEKGRWYTIRVRVTDHKIEAWIDRQKQVDVDTTGKKISIRTEVEPSRPLGICSYATSAGLRNIRWRSLEKKE